MKKQLLLSTFALFLINFFATFAQTVPVCGDHFYDPAGPTSMYSNDTDYTVTICPNNPGEKVTVTFLSFATEANWDALYVFNGNSTTSPQISSTNPAGNVPGGLAGGYWGTVNPGTFTSTSADGCLTFRFVSDNSVVDDGWDSIVSCALPVSCPAPTSLSIAATNTTSVTLGWTNNSSATSWEVIALPCGTVPTSTTTGIITTTNPFTITGLNPAVCYNLYVRAVCSSTNISAWSNPVTVVTNATCPNPTQLFTTLITTTSITFGWDEIGSATSWQVIILPCGSAPPTATSVGATSSTNSYMFNGLNPLTCYNIYVRAICSPTDSSLWSGPITATTLFAAPTCGGTFTDAAGSAVNYANNSDSTVTICPTVTGEVVTVTFNSFDTEATWDGLYVFDGNSITSPQIASANAAANVPGGLAGSYWGTAIPGPFTSSHPSGCLTFRFRSDPSINRPGWVASITCGPSPTCPKPTLLNASAITATSLTLGWTQTGLATSWEVLAVPCGSPAPTATTSGTSTTTNPFILTGLNPLTCYNLYVRAVCSPTDFSAWSTPITATTLYAPPTCGGIFSDLQGITANYLNNADSTVTICPTIPNEIVTVTFTSFNTEATWDGLYVFDGNSISSPQIASTNAAANVPGGIAGSFWGTAIPGPFTSSDPSGCLTFRFRSDGSVTNPGWVANVTCSPPPTCPRPTYLVTSGGTINSVTLGWTNNSTATSWEVVALPCGTFPTGSTTGTITSSNPFTITGLSTATCYNLFVRAICSPTDSSLWSTNNSFTTLAIPPACGGNYIDNGGIGANYLPNSDSTVTICPTIPGEVVTVTFTSFNVETTFDALYVFDGNSITSPQIASSNGAASVPGGVSGGYWGTTAPGPFTSTDPSGCLTFRFRSDGVINNAGWASNVSCAPPVDKILLIAFVDQNTNGIKDVGESLYSNGSFIYDQNNSGINVNAYSPIGRYSIFDSNPTNTYDFSYEVQPEYLPYYSSGTTTYNDISIPVGSGTQILYFPITLTLGYNDVTISIVPLSPPRPGLTYINKIVYKNLGVTATSGTITFTKPTPVAILAISQAGTVATPTGFTYAFTNLLPNETRFFTVTMTVPSSPTVVLNDLLTATASITAPANDINLANNTSVNSQIVVNSFDPNDKMESHGDEIPFSLFSQDDYLFYTIRFQNNGTANAIDVKIEDILDSKLDPESIRMINSSHNYTMTQLDNEINWTFNNIQLVPFSVSQDLSMGFVHFKIKLFPGFVAGDLVSNEASIFFDSNPAIVTNTFNTKFITLLGIQSNELGDFVMYPNPANNNVTFSMEDSNEIMETITVTDILGKNIRKISNIANNSILMDVSNLSKGVYFVAITTQSNLKVTKKLVVE